MTYRVELKNHPALEIHAETKDQFRKMLNDFLADKPNVKIVRIIEDF